MPILQRERENLVWISGHSWLRRAMLPFDTPPPLPLSFVHRSGMTLQAIYHAVCLPIITPVLMT